MKRLILAVLSLALVVFVVYARSSKIEAIKTPLSQVLRLNFQDGDPLSLHPQLGIDLRCRVIEKLLFEGLTRSDERGICQMAAAEKVDISPSQTTYTFKIRPHLWSNGQPVTAYHFESAWKKAIAPDSLCMRADLFYIIKNAKDAKLGKAPLDKVGIKATDKNTLVVQLENPAPYFLDLITHPVFSPTFSDEKEPTAFNGPFTIENWKHDDSLKLARNPNYWDKHHVPLHEINIQFVKDSTTALYLFEKGELDYMGDPITSLPLDVLSSATFAKRLAYQDVARIYWIYLNTEKFPFSSPKMRKAFAYALDRQALAQQVFQGCLPHKSPVPKNLSLLEEKDMFSDNDASIALALFEEGLQELGMTRQNMDKVVLNYSTITGQKDLAEAIQQRWKKVLDVDVALEGTEWSVLASYFNNGKFQMGGVLRSAVYNDPLYHLEIFKEKSYPYNASNWEKDDYKQLIHQASSTSDLSVRRAHLKQAEKMLVEEMPVIPIFVDTYKYMTNRNLKGFVIDKSGCIDFKKAYFEPLRYTTATQKDPLPAG